MIIKSGYKLDIVLQFSLTFPDYIRFHRKLPDFSKSFLTFTKNQKYSWFFSLCMNPIYILKAMCYI